MYKVLQISIEVNSGSVGRIAEQIGQAIIADGGDSYITYARDNLPSNSKTIKIGNRLGILWHVLNTRLFDTHAFHSTAATKKLIKEIIKLQPNIIHLHHLHGYYINIEVLFEFLSNAKIPVIWTFHDCWSFTGHCAHFEFAQCDKWQTHCNNCPQKKEYPKSILFDNSKVNFAKKKKIFSSLHNLTIVSVSEWLSSTVKKSFLSTVPNKVIYNGVDTSVFNAKAETDIRKRLNIESKFIILGVAYPWTNKKGLGYFIELAESLDDRYKIILIGLKKQQIKKMSKNIIALPKTKNAVELAGFYNAADVFVNCTLEEALGLTNLEAQACGTPVITFMSGGAPETVVPDTGIVVSKGNMKELISAVETIKINGKNYYSQACRQRIKTLFKKEDCFNEYITLYRKVLAG